MPRTSVKLFQRGSSQAVRIPREYRFECDRVHVFRDLLTGDIVLSENPDSWDDYFSVLYCHGLAKGPESTPRRTARLFSSDGAQAALIPAIFRFDYDQVYLFEESMSGDVILSRHAHGWDDFFRLVERIHVPVDGLFERDSCPPPIRAGF